MQPPRVAGLLLAAAVLSAGGPVAARCGEAGAPERRAVDMSLGGLRVRPRAVASEAGDDGPVVACATSPESARARSLFEAGSWAEAAPLLDRVVRGETGDDRSHRQIARFHLGVALYRMGLHTASLEVFGAVADAPDHYGFREALGWLAALDAALPEAAGVADRVDRYIGDEADARRNGASARVDHLLGWAAYNGRRYEAAAAAFAQVDRRSDLYPRSQFMLGVSYTLLRKYVAAVKAFQQVVVALDEGTRGEDAGDMRNLAYVSMARAYYTATVRIDEPCAPTLDANKLSAAAKYWGRVDGDLWPEAQLESSWAYFMSGDLGRVLGNLNNLESGYFEASLYPEADVLRGILYYSLCRYDDALTIVARMERRYLPIRRELAALIARLDGRDEDVLAFYGEVRGGRVHAKEIVRPIVETVIGDRPILKSLAYARFVGAEEGVLRALPASFRGSPLGEEVAAGLSRARGGALHGAAARVRALYQRRLAELDAQLEDARKLIIDVRAAETQAAPVPEASMLVSRGMGDDEHVAWPFDGEFWRDEIGSYRAVVTSRCGR
jgi:tetratricopeptide (TPR) repeat protein